MSLSRRFILPGSCGKPIRNGRFPNCVRRDGANSKSVAVGGEQFYFETDYLTGLTTMLFHDGRNVSATQAFFRDILCQDNASKQF